MKLSPCAPDVILHALPPAGDVLEVGCGEGVLLCALTGCGRYHVSAAEPNPHFAQAAAEASGVPVLCAGAEALPFADASFDALVLECVFSLCEPEKTVAELARVLRPGGCVVIADLFVSGTETTLQHSPMIKKLYTLQTLRTFFEPQFAFNSFSDHTVALRAMFAQMLMDGTMCDCVDEQDLPILRAAKPGYGVWIWTRR